MTAAKKEKHKKKRKEKKKLILKSKANAAIQEKGWELLEEALFCHDHGMLPDACSLIEKAAELLPKAPEVFKLMGVLGAESKNPGMELKALEGFERMGAFTDVMAVSRPFLLYRLGRFQEALNHADQALESLTTLKVKGKKEGRKVLQGLVDECRRNLLLQGSAERIQKKADTQAASAARLETRPAPRAVHAAQPGPGRSLKPRYPEPIPRKEEKPGPDIGKKTPELPPIPIAYTLDRKNLTNALSTVNAAGPQVHALALKSHEIRFKESYETLACLPGLSQVTSFWYQEETAKKVLKRFRGRALLSDEVGLGKTIEALMVLSEYLHRGMVKTALILTPAPLVSQWKEELSSKFNLDVPSTDDPGFRSGDGEFWMLPMVIASINQAKSKKNYSHVVERHYDMVIVDEAHHLKNKSTVSWKLVNALQKRFILLLTATPVENNLMELYNLITLLKPGQLETATEFRKKFMTRGDGTDPKNRPLLKELLGEVMIRNTRALAGINIPPRFAETIRIDPTPGEQAFYARLESLIMVMNRDLKGTSRLAAKHLLAQAGSSPTAVDQSLSRMLEKETFPEEYESEIRALKMTCRTTVDTPKNKALLKLITAAPEKLIVFVKYTATLHHLSEFLEWNRISFSLFHGAMSNLEKDRQIAAFQNDNQVLITTEIGGEGRNLQFCSRMVNYDLPWNPMKIEQRIGRIHRIGQTSEVKIFNFCAAGSIEDYILEILDRKINMFEMVIGEIDMILGRVNDEKDFEDLIYDMWVSSESEQERKKAFDSLASRLKRAKTGYARTRELDEKLFGDTYEL
ncbi:MAG: SNF2-related protein [Pseudomonadota bacterium]